MRDAHETGRVVTSSASPHWVGEPMSWAKLEEIDDWLARDATRYDDNWVVQAHLTLAEGRVQFARREDGADETSARARLVRLQGAKSSYQLVLADPNANDAQRTRARAGLQEIEVLYVATTGKPASKEAASPYLSRSSWRANAPIVSRLDPAQGRYDRITIHHTADVPGSRFDGSLADSIQVLQNVQRNHVETRSYGDIGYHYLIDAAGRVFLGRDMKFQGAHAGGTNNVNNIGVCMLGNFENSRPSATAMAALNQLVSDLRREHRIDRTRIVGHAELKSTKCPGSILSAWTRDYRRSGPSLANLGQSADARSAALPFNSAPLGSAAPVPLQAVTIRNAAAFSPSSKRGASSTVR